MPSWFERYSQPPPTSARPRVERVPVDGAECPACGSADVRRYPVSNQYGPRIATKCQACLHTLSIERPGPEDRWPSYRSVTADWKPSPIESSSQTRGSKGATT
jgi:hypothetical protein